MKHFSAYKIVICAMFAAMVCVATMLIRIPMPATGGYANLGDGVILIAAFMLHPLHAAVAAGLGSLLADLLAGYASFAPGTLVIKAGVALIAALVYDRFGREKTGAKPFAAMVMGAVAAEVFMVLGYFAYEALVLGYGIAAAGSIPGNIGQMAVGVIVACIVVPVFNRSKELRELVEKARK